MKKVNTGYVVEKDNEGQDIKVAVDVYVDGDNTYFKDQHAERHVISTKISSDGLFHLTTVTGWQTTPPGLFAK